MSDACTQTKLTPLGVAALALLAERAMHPYEMYQLLVQRMEDRLVKVRPGSLYHTVNRLDEQGLVTATGTEREGNRPERTVYDITDGGREALTARLIEMLGTPINEYPEFPLAVSEAHNLPHSIVVSLLQQRLAALGEEADVIDAGIASVTERRVDRKYWLDLTYQRSIIHAQIEWITALIDDLTSGALTW